MNQVSFPARPDISRSIRVMDAKSANQKKKNNCISHKWGGDRKPSHGFGKR
jgi:hypothetical protein